MRRLKYDDGRCSLGLLLRSIKYLYHTILYYTILYYTILYYTILYYTILYYTILYYTILYYTILYYTILYYTILYYTILYYTILYYPILYYILYYTLLGVAPRVLKCTGKAAQGGLWLMYVLTWYPESQLAQNNTPFYPKVAHY